LTCRAATRPTWSTRPRRIRTPALAPRHRTHRLTRTRSALPLTVWPCARKWSAIPACGHWRTHRCRRPCSCARRARSCRRRSHRRRLPARPWSDSLTRPLPRTWRRSSWRRPLRRSRTWRRAPNRAWCRRGRSRGPCSRNSRSNRSRRRGRRRSTRCRSTRHWLCRCRSCSSMRRCACRRSHRCSSR